jgi:phospho-N-acetylmuramoyl-pentapeptide-transferase
MISLLVAGIVSFFTSLLGMPILIRWLALHGIGQPIRSDGPQSHQKKKGTPTMGGIAIVVAAVFGYVVPHFTPGSIPFSRQQTGQDRRPVFGRHRLFMAGHQLGGP